MTISSKLLLSLSFFIILFNGLPSGYILFHERLGGLYGDILFIFTSLLGALLASVIIVQDRSKSLYVYVCVISNVMISFYPVYFIFVANYMIPHLLDITLFFL